MPWYRRAYEPGATYFLTIVTEGRRELFVDENAQRMLREAVTSARARRPFTLVQSVLLPDHFHMIVKLPEDDADFSTRIASIKSEFTRRWLTANNVETVQSESRVRQRYRGVWQKRFWEHLVRDESDLARCESYIWFNPVKHALVRCPHNWPWTSFHREISAGRMPQDWRCVCNGKSYTDDGEDIDGAEMD